jgi:hypothetical protein
VSPVSDAQLRRDQVLGHITDVFGDRLYESASQSRSVRPELQRLERDGLIEPYWREGEKRWRRTLAGEDAFHGGSR